MKKNFNKNIIKVSYICIKSYLHIPTNNNLLRKLPKKRKKLKLILLKVTETTVKRNLRIKRPVHDRRHSIQGVAIKKKKVRNNEMKLS